LSLLPCHRIKSAGLNKVINSPSRALASVGSAPVCSTLAPAQPATLGTGRSARC
jgi:hypothetical protein